MDTKESVASVSVNALCAIAVSGEPMAKRDALPALEHVSDKAWNIATRRLDVIRPAIEAGPPYRANLLKIAQEHGKGVATLYRWLEAYLDNRDTATLMPRRHSRRRPRLTLEVREIIRFVFDEFYATKQQRSLMDGIRQVQYECWKANIKTPHANTIRKHLEQMQTAVGNRAFLRLRGQKKRADDRFELRDGVFDGHEAPWFRVQIDHTRLDVMVVDEKHRLTVGRPYLTFAVDSYSRMVLGFNISLDPSGRLSTGLCIVHSMLPKDTWLKDHGISNPWPCYGKPGTLHFDNGKEFLSDWIQRACQRYDILIEHRPVATPHFGPQVERTIRTLNTYLRTLSGATFSNPDERGEYDSDKFARFTLAEIEGIITEWITGTYHRRIHRGLRRPPLNVYNDAVLGRPESLGSGRRVFDYDLRRLRLDFMPSEQRTVQHYGVTFDYLTYGGDVLAPYVNATDEQGQSKKFYFHRDPRRINEIYFYADDVNEFYVLHPRQMVGDMNLWDWRSQIRRAKEAGEKEVDVAALYESMQQLQKREAEAAERTKAARRNATRRIHHGNVIPLPVPPREEHAANWEEDVEPFDDIRLL